MNHYSCSTTRRNALTAILSGMAALCLVLTACGAAPDRIPQLTLTPAAAPAHKFAPTAVPIPNDAPVVSEDIFKAIDAGDLETVTNSIKGGTAVDSVSKDGSTLLMWAASDGQLEIMRYLIGQGASLNMGRNSDKGTPLIFATYYQKPEAVKLLLESGAEVDLAMDQNITPLIFAASRGYADIVDLLLAAGADPNLFTTSGTDPLYKALSGGDTHIVQALIEHHADVNVVYSGTQPYPNSPLAIAAWKGNADQIKALIDKGARDSWLSAVPGFDPYNFQPLDVSLVDGEIRVSGGSQPLFLGESFAQRPWVDPGTLPKDTTGTNFFTWTDTSTHQEVLILIISDKSGHKSQLSVMLPIFNGDEGITYTAGVTRVLDNGPFVTLRVHTDPGIQGKIILHRGKDATEKAVEAQGVTTFDLAHVEQQNEPLTIEIFNGAGTLLDTIDIDCIYRGASEGVVFYDAYPAKP